MPVQAVFKFTNDGDDRRIVAGTIDSGRVRVGDEVVFHPSGKRTRVKSLECIQPLALGRRAEEATGSRSRSRSTSRAARSRRAREPQPVTATRIRASIFWLGTRAARGRTELPLKLGTARVSCIRAHRARARRVDAADAHRSHRRRAQRGGRAAASSSADRFRPHRRLAATSRFVLVDNQISGGGVVRDALPTVERPRSGEILAVVWLTGAQARARPPSRAGSRAARERSAAGRVLDGDTFGGPSPARVRPCRARRARPPRRVSRRRLELRRDGVWP